MAATAAKIAGRETSFPSLPGGGGRGRRVGGDADFVRCLSTLRRRAFAATRADERFSGSDWCELLRGDGGFTMGGDRGTGGATSSRLIGDRGVAV